MKLLLDMNLSPKIAAALSLKGIESVHWLTVGLPEATDTEIISYAKENSCVVVTHDLDFSTVLSVSHGKLPSVIQIRSQDLNVEQITDMVSATVRENVVEIVQGAILSIDSKRARLRLLPL